MPAVILMISLILSEETLQLVCIIQNTVHILYKWRKLIDILGGAEMLPFLISEGQCYSFVLIDSYCALLCYNVARRYLI